MNGLPHPFPLLQTILRHKGQVEITVAGSSMESTLSPGDTVTVQPRQTYAVGDVLVFDYEQEGLLVHRLLKAENGRCFCKGDNSYRLEAVTPDRILGAVRAVNGDLLPPWSDGMTALSLAVNRAFVRCRLDVEALRKTALYRVYAALLFGQANCMAGLSQALTLIEIDDETVCTFDAQNGKTRYFDGTAAVLLRALSEPKPLSVLAPLPPALAYLLEEGILEPKGDPS